MWGISEGFFQEAATAAANSITATVECQRASRRNVEAEESVTLSG